MPKHEFGLMNNPPVESKRYDKYNPEEYDNLISVYDNYIMRIADELNEIHMYWHTLKNSQKRLAYCGITLIPPEAAAEMLLITEKYPELQQLTRLLEIARDENKYIIHFGI